MQKCLFVNPGGEKYLNARDLLQRPQMPNRRKEYWIVLGELFGQTKQKHMPVDKYLANFKLLSNKL